MSFSYIENIVLIFLSMETLIRGGHSWEYSDLQATGVACPERDSCRYKNKLTYIDRNCECDYACDTYNDCCIDVRRRNSERIVHPTNLTCLHYGEHLHSGVYVVANCNSDWSGPIQIRQKCEGPPDFSDPLASAPVTRTAQAVTYKNIFCAECNNANVDPLETFQIKIHCEGLDNVADTQIYADLTYNQEKGSWGINRMNEEGQLYFVTCNIIYDVPGYLNNSVRFCRSNIISTCMPNWNRPHVKKACEEYMAVVYSVYNDTVAYRNPHCATCNRQSVEEVMCISELKGRKKLTSTTVLVDINPSEGEVVGKIQVATPQCRANHKYDPFFKRCKRLRCAISGRVVINGECVPSG